MAFGRVCLIGDAAFAVRPHAAAGTAKAADDGWALAEELTAAAATSRPRWPPGSAASSRSAAACWPAAGRSATAHSSPGPSGPATRG